MKRKYTSCQPRKYLNIKDVLVYFSSFLCDITSVICKLLLLIQIYTPNVILEESSPRKTTKHIEKQEQIQPVTHNGMWAHVKESKLGPQLLLLQVSAVLTQKRG